jgi:hypothetical protein
VIRLVVIKTSCEPTGMITVNRRYDEQRVHAITSNEIGLCMRQ